MRLYLVQHGKARSEAEDPERSLTVRGEEEGLRRRSGKGGPVSIQRHLVSGKERARKMGSRLVSQTGNGLRGGF